MTRYLLDAFAWIEYLEGTALGGQVRALLEDEENEVLTSAYTVAEVASKSARRGKDGRDAASRIEASSTIVPLEFTVATSSGLVHAERRKKVKDFPLGDATVIAAAKALHATIVTGDPHFKDEPNLLYLK